MDFRVTENLAQLRQGKCERCTLVSLGMLVIYFTWHISELLTCSEAHFEKWVIAVYLRL